MVEYSAGLESVEGRAIHKGWSRLMRHCSAEGVDWAVRRADVRERTGQSPINRGRALLGDRRYDQDTFKSVLEQSSFGQLEIEIEKKKQGFGGMYNMARYEGRADEPEAGPIPITAGARDEPCRLCEKKGHQSPIQPTWGNHHNHATGPTHCQPPERVGYGRSAPYLPRAITSPSRDCFSRPIFKLFFDCPRWRQSSTRQEQESRCIGYPPHRSQNSIHCLKMAIAQTCISGRNATTGNEPQPWTLGLFPS